VDAPAVGGPDFVVADVIGDVVETVELRIVPSLDGPRRLPKADPGRDSGRRPGRENGRH
jgi:hypothetical protein